MGFYSHLRGANKMACNKLALNKFNNIGLPILRNLTIFSLQKWLFHEILANKTVHKYFLHCLSTAHPDPSSEGHMSKVNSSTCWICAKLIYNNSKSDSSTYCVPATYKKLCIVYPIITKILACPYAKKNLEIQQE